MMTSYSLALLISVNKKVLLRSIIQSTTSVAIMSRAIMKGLFEIQIVKGQIMVVLFQMDLFRKLLAEGKALLCTCKHAL